MDFLEGLNPPQREAVQAMAGPLLILAGPGSGKTRVITYRIAYLIRQAGIRPHNILAVTFTNKAAREMIGRLQTLVPGAVERLTIGTFHAVCARLLRREGKAIGLDSGFSIYDDDDQISVVRDALADLNVDEKKFAPRAILGAISAAKSELRGPLEYGEHASGYLEEVILRVYRRYQELLAERNALDFDDLLMTTVRLFREAPAVLEKYQERYQHVLVDEFQDTNFAQYAIVKQLAGKHRNICVVGDPDQCLPPGTLVQTPGGPVPIETLETGAVVRAASGRGNTTEARVEAVHSRSYDGPIVEIRTVGGRVLQATPNHVLFARLNLHADVHYVYLMYRADKGYRVGRVVGSRKAGRGPENAVGLQVRVNQEHVDKVWVLKVCSTLQEALYWEQYYAFQYGLPTTVFHVAGRSMTMGQEDVDRLYATVETTSRAQALMRDLHLFAEYPHYRPQGIATDSWVRRRVVNLNMFGHWFTDRLGRSSRAGHRVSLNTSDGTLRAPMASQGVTLRPGKPGKWRVERAFVDYGRAIGYAETAARSAGGLEVVHGAFLTAETRQSGLGVRYALQPASHIHPTMLLPVEVDGRIVEDEVAEVRWDTYRGPVYDLDVAGVHNYVANGVVVHNSIYAWRRADIRNILNFEADFPGCRTVLLEQNYRSTKTILAAAQAVISQNQLRKDKRLWTENEEGVPVVVREAYNDEEEAGFVVSEIERLVARGEVRLRDCAVMYRTNAQSRKLEEVFLRRRMPHRVVGIRFYQRREIKDVLAYLRCLANPDDAVSLLRIINVPARGIGQKTLTELQRWAELQGLSIYRALLRLASDEDVASPFSTRTERQLVGFISMMEELRAASADQSLLDLLKLVLDRTGYASTLRDDASEEGEDRRENVEELLRVAGEFAGMRTDAGLAAFLEEAALATDVDEYDENADAVALITLHAAKGLEFPAVFIVGMEDGIFPHARSLDDPKTMEEERRLCYVGITRAKRRLYLVYAAHRTLYGNTVANVPSRFLADIPSHLAMGSLPTRARGPATSRASTPRGTSLDPSGRQAPWVAPAGATAYQTPACPATRAGQPCFAPGDRVHHATFGEGIVVKSTLVKDDEEVEVAFPGIGMKKLSTAFAPLEKL